MRVATRYAEAINAMMAALSTEPQKRRETLEATARADEEAIETADDAYLEAVEGAARRLVETISKLM